MANLEFKNVSKSFGVLPVIQNLDLQVQDGELFVLLGPSGCGKSTILRLIAGLEEVDRGEILIDGKVVTKAAPKDRNIAMVFQNYALYPHMTIYDNLAFPLKVKKLPHEEIDRIVVRQARLLGLDELLERKPRTLSGGQRQRVALGRALVRNPQVFLFDEPLSNLDAKLRVSTRAEIAHLQDTLSATMLYVTHDQEEALSLGDRIAILNKGLLQQVGTPREIYNEPANTFCAGFVGTPRINLLELMADGDTGFMLAKKIRFCFPGNFPKQPVKSTKQKLILAIRPENIGLERSGESDLEIEVEVTRCEFGGDRTVIYGDLDGTEVRIKCLENVGINPGTMKKIYIKLRHCLFFDEETGNRIRGEIR